MNITTPAVSASNSQTLIAQADWLRGLPVTELAELDSLLSAELWVPLPGPQTQALQSPADILFYGGAAGGGKTDLAIGLALTQHERSIIYRREATQLQGIYDRMAEILGSRDGFNSQDKIWRLHGRQVEFGSCPNPGDEVKYQGRPHDLKVFDEICHFLEAQFRFLIGWKRTSKKAQRQRIVCLGNPPTDSDGEWVVRFWAPWLDPNHPKPAKPGELRWFVRFKGQDHDSEVDGPGYVMDPSNGHPIKPHSRTFIPSFVADNPFLIDTGYEATLQALPEPLRSQMLSGDFMAGRGDDPWQVIPTAWVLAAQGRWTRKAQKGAMDSVGVDVARGGMDKTIISRRHGSWYDELQPHPGSETPNGPVVAGLVVSAARDGAPIHVDVIGVGASVYDFLKSAGIQAEGVNVANSSEATDKSGKLRFCNKRAALYWALREALDPAGDQGIALPPDDELRADLCAPRWKLTARGVQMESKVELQKRLGRSPDRGDAVVLASIATRKRAAERKEYVPQGAWNMA